MALFYLSDGYLIGMGVWLVFLALGLWWIVRHIRRWRDRPRRLGFAKFALSVWMTCVPLTALELYFALVYDSTDSFNMTNVSKMWFDRHVKPQQKPLMFQSGEGIVYRDDVEFPATVGPDQHHICFVGDSFTFAQGVPDVADRFSNRIRTALQQEAPGKFLVSNLADAGTELHWIEQLLKNVFRDGHHIDTVVYVMCLNDIETFHERHRTYYQDFGSRTNAPQFFLFRDTYFFNLMYFRARQFSVPDVQNYYSFLEEYYAGEPWERMQRKIEDVHQLCRQNDVDFRIVVFPFLHNLGPDYPFRSAHAEIVRACRQLKIPTLDLEPVLTPHVADGLTVNRFDAHPNERANKLAAQAIQETLLSDIIRRVEEPAPSVTRPETETAETP